MKTKMLKSALSLLLVLLLCVSVIAPAITAADVDVAEAAADGDVLEKHAANTSISKSDLQGIFGDSTSITNTAYYGYAPVPEEGAELDTSTIIYVSNSSAITAGSWLALKTTAYTGSILNRKPDWTNADKRSQLNFSIRTYYNGDFSVTGSADGALYLNEEAASGTVRLYTDSEYTVTSAEVEGFTCEVTGVNVGEAFTPSSDLTVTATYTADASASFTLSAGEGGTASVLVDGLEATDMIPAGKSFEVVATPNANKGYQLDSIIVTKDGEEVEAVDGAYGPVADGEAYAVTVTFKYDPIQKSLEVDAADAKLERSDLDALFDGAYDYYGIAEENAPDTIEYLYDYNLLITHYKNDYDVTNAKYIIYGTNDGSVTSPNWTNAKLMELTVKLYYTGTFTVAGNDAGEVYLNGEAVSGSVRLYPDTEYTVTAKNIDEYTYTMEGAEDGVAFTPSAAVNVTVTYMKEAYATLTVNANEGGTVVVRSNDEVVTERISEGDTFTVEATPNANKGYKLEGVVVTKDGEAVEAVDGAYGPVADGEAYAITVTFKYDPPKVSKEVDANKGQVSRSDLSGLFDGAYSYYGIAPVSDPDNITYLAVALTSDYSVTDGGEYCIYGSNDGNILSPRWTNAKLMLMTVRTYYNGTFTVTGNEDGEVYLNGEAITGSAKLYVDTEYTVTAKEIDNYFYTMEGAEDGVAFTPSADVNVTVAYNKIAYATFSLRVTDGGTAEVQVNGEAVSDRISEGDSFTVVATPNANKGYKLDSVVVSKDGEEVEAVDGAYGPVADGEEYAITVTFVYDPPRVIRDVDANKGQVSRSDLSSLFNGAYNYYGIATTENPDDVTYLAIALTADYDVEVGTEYIIYGTNDGNILSPRWTNAKLMVMTVRTYYNVTFTVSGNDDGEVYLNGEPVEGTVQLFTDTEYTVTMKQIDHFVCDLYGVEEGVPFTPTEDMEITASYMKEQYATLTVDANEGGTVEVTSDGEPVFDKIADEAAFEVTITPDTANGYYVESWEVVRDGEVIEPIDGVYGPVIGGEVYEVNVTFEQATLTADDCEVYYSDIKNKDFDAVEATILANTELLPEYLTENAETKVEYAAYSLLGYDIYEPLDYTGALSHAFGTSSLGGELMDGNTEKIRVTVTLSDYDITLQAYATATVKDTRKPARVEGESITITYGDDLKAAILEVIAVYDEFGEEIEFTDDDITVNPESLNANLLSAYRAQEVTVTYGGNEEYAMCSGTVDVYVNRAQSSLDTKSETITYGETPAAEVITTPEDLDYIKVIGGIDGDAQGFVSIDIPQSVKEKMQIKIGGAVVLDIYDILCNYIGEEGSTLGGLKDFVNDIYDRINSSEIIRQAIESSGFNMEIFDTIINFVNELPDFDSNLKIRLGQVPKNAGAYLLFAVSTDTNYTTSADVSYIVILPQSTTEDNTIELRFKNEIEDYVLTYEEAQEFEFGGDFYINDELQETDKLHTLYVGTTFAGDAIAQEEPVSEPGIYTETVYILGGNYWATPIVRVYTVSRIETELYMEDLTVDYDGEAHAVEATTDNDDIDLTDKVTYTYIGKGYLSTEAPVNAGEYTVIAVYEGDEMYAPATVSAKLTINKLSAAITVSCTEEVTYGDINYFNVKDVAAVEYTVSGTINDDELGIIIPTLDAGETFPNVGEYTASVLFYQTNNNYDVTIEDAVLTIVPRDVTITVDNAEKEYGDDDPEFTYQIEGLAFRDTAEVTITRIDEENVGSYEISATVTDDPNYNFIVVPGTFTIHKKSVYVTIEDAEKVYGDNDPAFVYTVVDANGDPLDAEAIGLTVSRTEGDVVDEYEISAGIEDSVNYDIHSNTATFTIKPKEVFVTVNDAEKVYGAEDPDLTYTLTDAEGNIIVDDSIVVTLSRDGDDNVGTYEITAQTEANQNYIIDTTDTGTFTIHAKKIVVVIDNKQKILGEADPEFTYTVKDENGEDVDEEIGLAIARVVGEKAGTFTIFAAWVTNPNYILDKENSTGTLTIVEINRYLLGDADGDGVVSILDATAIQRKLSHNPFAIIDERAADVDGDGEVTSLDATWIQRYVAKMTVEFPINEYIIIE